MYKINPHTGAATLAANLINRNSNSGALDFDSNKTYSIDFNPAADRLDVVSAGRGGYARGGRDLQEGKAPTQTNKQTNNFSVNQIVYTRNFSSTIKLAPSTKMFETDSSNVALLRQD